MQVQPFFTPLAAIIAALSCTRVIVDSFWDGHPAACQRTTSNSVLEAIGLQNGTFPDDTVLLPRPAIMFSIEPNVHL